MYPPVRDWLRAQGYAVHVELFGCDVVGVKDETIVAVELKLCLTKGLGFQCQHAAAWADYVYCAIPTTPKYCGGMLQQGIGVLIVKDGKVKQKHKARPQPWYRHRSRKRRFEKLAGRAPAMEHELAGLPCCPALKEQRKRREE